jgi:hypothetical protein
MADVIEFPTARRAAGFRLWASDQAHDAKVYGHRPRELAFREVLAHLDAGDLPAALARVPACDRATAAAALAERAA